jgi:hypothetical protein
VDGFAGSFAALADDFSRFGHGVLSRNRNFSAGGDTGQGGKRANCRRRDRCMRKLLR